MASAEREEASASRERGILLWCRYPSRPCSASPPLGHPLTQGERGSMLAARSCSGRHRGVSLAAMGLLDTTILPTAADVEAAAKHIAGVAVRMPLVNCGAGRATRRRVSSRRRPCSEPARSVPRRLRRILDSGAARRRRGRPSSGNHAQGVAAAARLVACARPSSCRRCAQVQARPHAHSRRRARTLRPRRRGPRGDRRRIVRQRGATRFALRRSAGHRRTRHHRPACRGKKALGDEHRVR